MEEVPDIVMKFTVALTDIANFIELSTRFTDDPNELILAEIKQDIADAQE